MAKICQKQKGCKHDLTCDYTTEYIYRNYYRKNGGRLDNSQFRGVIRLINEELKQNIALGKTIYLPFNFGQIEVRRKKNKINIVNGKAKVTNPVDWGKTHELWMEDEEAFNDKIVVRGRDELLFKIYWKKGALGFKHKSIYSFRPARGLKSLICENIKNGKLIDAIPICV